MTNLPAEPLSYQTAIPGLELINLIFREQLSFYSCFSPVYVSAPFRITDFHSFEESLLQSGTQEQRVKDKLSIILQMTIVNMDLYRDIQRKSFRGVIGSYFMVNNDFRAIAIKMQKYANEIDQNPHKQVFIFLSELFDFCNKVKKYVEECLDTPFGPLLDVKNVSNPAPNPKTLTNLPDKWYALYHAICLVCGKNLPRFQGSSRNEIAAYGKHHYHTGDGFRKSFKELDINNMVAYVRSLPVKDRAKWKKNVIEISNNDADIVSWVKKAEN